MGHKARNCLMIITGAFHLGGGIAAANRLAYAALQDAGYTMDIFALNEVALPMSSHRGQYHSFSNNKLRFTAAVWKSLMSRRYTVAFCDHVNLASILLPLRMFTNCHIIVRLNGIEVFAPNPTFEGRLGLRAATHLMAISDFTRSQVINQFPDLTVKTIDLSLPLTARELSVILTDDSTQLKLKSVDGVEQSLLTRCILQVGRMSSNERYKGQDILIQAMEEIITWYPTAQLILVGGGDDYERLRGIAMSQPAHVRNNIFMPGFVENTVLQQLYQHCYLFAMPSRGEGFGLVYIEAMSWGKPCLGSRIDAAACIIQDNITGLLVNDPTDHIEVAEKIISLLNQPKRARQMGYKGRQRVEEYFTYEHFKERFLKALEL